MAKSKNADFATPSGWPTLTSDEMLDLHSRMGDIRSAVELAFQNACNAPASEEGHHVIGLLSIIRRELQPFEDMLDPTALSQYRARHPVAQAQSVSG